MDFKFSKDSDDSQNKAKESNKGNQNALLLLLLLLVGGFAYIYFFTGLIKPLKVEKPAEVQTPQVIKKPLPSRDGEPPKVGETSAPEIKKEATAPSAAKPEPPKVAQASPVVAPVAKETPKPKDEVKKPEITQAAGKKPMPVLAEKKDQKPVAAVAGDKKAVPVEKKPAAAIEKKPTAAIEKKQPVTIEKKDVVAKKSVDVKKPAVGELKEQKTVARSEKKPATGTGQAAVGRWTVTVGSYQLEDALAVDLVRVRKAGLDAAVLPGARKKAEMNRLLLGEFGDRTAAQGELDKIRRHTSDAFILDQGGVYAVYAGSYLLNERALSEKERLAAAGFSLTLKRSEVSIPSKTLTAGTFSDKKAAESALKKLKAAGVKANLTQQ